MSQPTITYSPSYTIVPTYECFNHCTYCNFRTNLGQSPWLSLENAEKILKSLTNQGICEILILSGEVHPDAPQREAWFQRIYDLCALSLTLGFLPHTNVGILTWEEMKKLKQVNVSMGLMLEQLTPQLLETVHRHAPSKHPQLRLEQLQWAGMLGIPFTTGLLLGIGEKQTDWQDGLKAIAQLQAQWGHIQEVILQPYSLGENQSLKTGAFDSHQMPEIVRLARTILPKSITIQIPPNLIETPEILLACLDAGASDLGGIGPKDEVNPDYPHIQVEALQVILEAADWCLVPRLPVYPQYLKLLPLELKRAIANHQNRYAAREIS